MRVCVLLACALLFLAACDSIEEAIIDGQRGPLPPLDQPIPASQVSGMGDIGPADMPNSGSARFEGTITVGLQGDEAVGDLTLDVDFGPDDVAATAGGFRSDDGGAVISGQLSGGGEVDGTGLEASLSGNLSGPDPDTGLPTSSDVDLNLDGEFRTNDYEDGPLGVEGSVSGTAGGEAVTGSFVAGRTR